MICNRGVNADSGSGWRSGSSTSVGVQQEAAVLSRRHMASKGGGVIASNIAQHACEVIDTY